MKIRLRHWAKLTNAEIALEGITVLAGSNGVGKSSVCRALMTLTTLIRRVGERIADEREHSLHEQFAKWVGKLLPGKILPLAGYTADRLEARKIPYDIPETLFDAFIHPIADSKDEQEHCRKIFLNAYPQWQTIAEGIRKRPDADYVKLIVRKAFLKAFDGQIAPLRNGHWTPSVEISDGDVRTAVTFNGNTPSEIIPPTLSAARLACGTFYLEPSHALDRCAVAPSTADDRYGEGYSTWKNLLYTNSNIRVQDLSLEATERLDRIREILCDITKTIHGHLEIADRTLVFSESEANQPIQLSNIASGVKSAAVIIRALELGAIQPGDILIIDEPESNLHPEWQLVFARFLAELQSRLGIRLLLSTHSPYFLMAIQTYAGDLKLNDRCRFYQFVPSEEANGLFETKDVTSSPDKIFETMYRPFESLGF